MFTKKSKLNPELEEAIDAALCDLKNIRIDSPDYPSAVDQVAKLYKLKEQDTPKRVSADTLAMIGGNLAGIALILGYERANVVTSKALGFVLKLR